MHKIFIKYRRLIILLTHLALVALSLFLAFLLRFDFFIPPAFRPFFLTSIVLVALIKLPVFFYFGIFQGMWRYVSIGDLWQIIKANTFATLVFLLCTVFIFGHNGYPRSVFLLDWIVSIMLISGVRLLTRVFRENFQPQFSQFRKKVLIVGAGKAGILMAKEIRSNAAMGMSAIGFIDDDPAKKNRSIEGKKIFGNRSCIPEAVEKYGVEEIIIAIPSLKGEEMRDILTFCRIPKVKIKTLPRFEMLFSGNLQLKPREVRPEDLLGREPVMVDTKEIRSFINRRRVLVTGAGGSIGSEITTQLSAMSPAEVILLDHNENNVYFLSIKLKSLYPRISFTTVIGDIKDVGLLKRVFSAHRPQVVFHCAAHKHVPLMQENPAAAVKNNIIGTRNVIYASSHYGVERFVLISTDKAVNPINVMGISKRIAEMILQAKARYSNTKFMAVRFGNVLGSDGSVVPLFQKQINDGGPVTVTHKDAERYFMSIPEAATLVLQAAAMGKGGEIFILDMGEPVKIADLARNLITLSGLAPDKDIPIRYVGLRDGEKLTEEIMLNTEKDMVTKHMKIFITKPNSFDPGKLRSQVRELAMMADRMDRETVIGKLREILPEDSQA